MAIYLLGAFLLSMICGFVFTPVILNFCKWKKLYDVPDERKIHKKAIPRLGGISFIPSMLTAYIVILFVFSITNQKNLPITIGSGCFILGLFIIYLTGIVDDLMGLNAKSKFVVQVVTAFILPLAGLYINNLYGLFGIHEIPYYIGFPLTIFIVVFIDNALNLIDGIDGLATGLSIMALCGFLAYFIAYEVFQNTYCIVVAGLIGALIAFGYFNIFGTTEHNTKIFMGDSGSLSLGYSLGFLAIKCVMDNTVIWPTRTEALLMPVTLLFVPTADVVRVTLHRLRHRQPLFNADKNHIHHKLMRSGMSQHQTLIFILAISLSYIVLNWLLFDVVEQTIIIIIDILLYCFINMCINHFIDSHNMNHRT
jgi:UDP-N-acetylmuramyl pentapeptide phosphotransferase/UDP-N-acetylglucosamine-1-phosphate transferase